MRARKVPTSLLSVPASLIKHARSSPSSTSMSLSIVQPLPQRPLKPATVAQGLSAAKVTPAATVTLPSPSVTARPNCPYVERVLFFSTSLMKMQCIMRRRKLHPIIYRLGASLN